MRILLVIGLLVSTLAWSQTKSLLSLPYEKYTESNGLEVILQHDSRIPFVAISVWVHAGADVEKPGKTGFAHLFEHLMFQGTPHVGDDKHFAYLQEAGGSGINGTTDFDRTNYFEVVPSNEIELALWLESDRLGFLLDGITQAKLDEQRGVVQNERRQSYENQPYGLASEKSWQVLFGKDHPYYGRVIGSMEDLNQASLDDVRDFFHKYYSVENATLAIVGDFNPATIKQQIQKYFGSLKGTPKPKRANPPASHVEGEVRLNEEDSLATLTMLQVQYLTPPQFTPGDADFDVIAHLLTGDKTGRLSKVLVYDQQLVQSVDAAQQSMLGSSVFEIQTLFSPQEDPQNILNIIDMQLDSLVSDPPSEKEIQRAINQIKTTRIFALQKIGGFHGRAEQLQSYNHFIGKPDWLAEDLTRYDRVTPESIASYVERYLKPKNRTVLVVTPKVPS